MKGLFAMIAVAAVALAGFGAGQSGLLTSDCPGGQCQRTVPFNAVTAPVFEAPPAVGVAPVVNVDPAVVAPVTAPAVPNITVVVPDEAPAKGLNLTPEQKEALKSLLFQGLTLVVGMFLGRGTTGPMFSTLLSALLSYLQSKPPAAPAAARKRVLRRN